MRRWARRAALMLAAPTLFLVLLESVLALAGVHVPRYAGFDDPGRYWIPCAVPGRPPGYDRAFPRNYRRFPEAPPLFLRDKPQDGWRVFVLGESTVQGAPHEIGCFTDWLRLRCTAMLPDRTVEVVNAGNLGWHATDVRTLLQECLSLQPDLLVWMVGHNEFVPHNVLDLRDEVLHPVRHALRRAALGLRTTHWLAGMLPLLPRERGSSLEGLQGPDEPCFGPELPLLRERFSEATAGAVADARAAGVPIVLCTMPRNVADWPPTRSYFSEATRADPALRARWEQAYAAGTAALSAGDAAGALVQLTQALALDSASAKLHFALGRAHQALGEAEAARAAYLQALEQDGNPLRAQAWVEAVIRDVAARTGAPLVDLQALFDGQAALGLAGREFITDNCHPDLAGHELAASAILDVLEHELRLPLDRRRDVTPEEGRERLGLSAEQARIAKQVESVNLAKLALQAGVVDDAWRQAHDLCSAALEEDGSAWPVMGALGLLDAMAGDAASAGPRIRRAMVSSLQIRLSYLFFWKTDAIYRRAFAVSGVDMAAMESALTPAQRADLAHHVRSPGTR